MFKKGGERMRYDTERCALVASADEVCDLVFRSGNLDSRRPFSEKNALGIQSELEKSKGALYSRDRSFLNTSKYADMYYEISATAHGTVLDDHIPTVEGVKSVSGYEMARPPRRQASTPIWWKSPISANSVPGFTRIWRKAPRRPSSWRALP